MDSLTSTPQPALSHELRELINQRNILTAKSKSKVLKALDAQMKEDEKKMQSSLRNKAIDEIFTSEVSFLHQIELIMKYFKEPLESSDLMSASTRRLLFGNIESIYRVNGELVNQLRMQGSNVGAAFSYMAPFFKLYSMYAYNYRKSLNLLEVVTRHDKDLKLWLKSQERRPEVATTLSALLIAPIQRLPRYKLLLRQLLSLTPPTHPYYSTLSEAVTEIEKTIAHVDGVLFEQEIHNRLVKLQQCLVNSKPCIVGPNKRLLKEGILMKMSKNGRNAQKRYFILLNDSIVYCKLSSHAKDQQPPEDPGSLQSCCTIPINKCRVENILGQGVFKLTGPSETYILFSEHTEHSLEWVSKIQEAISEYEQNMKTLRKKSSSCNPLHLSRKRKCINEENVNNKENDVIPSKRAMYEQNNQEEAPRTNYFQSVKSLFQSFGKAVMQYVYPISSSIKNH